MRIRTAGIGLGLVLALGTVSAIALTWRPAIAPVTPPTVFEPALVKSGAQLAAIGDCAICHAAPNGAAYAGGAPLQTPFGAIYASNITPDPDTGIGTWSEAAFRRAMRDGVSRSGHFLDPAFPYTHYARVTPADITALYAFLMTRDPVKATTPRTKLPFPLNLRPIMAGVELLFLRHKPIAPNPARDATWNRGAYLVEGLGHCAACHTPRNALGAEDTAHPFTGGVADGWEAPGLTAATSPAAIAWTADALYRFLRHGLDDQHAASAGPMGAVSHDLSHVPEDDVRAMAIYIASMTDPGGHGATDPAREQQVAAKVAAAQNAPLQPGEGAAIFAGACAGCHGAGAPMMLNGRPSLALGSSVTAATARNATQTILYGLQPGPGERGPWMPPFAASLTDKQIAAVLGYLRGRFTDRPAWPDLNDSVHRIRLEKKLMIALTVNGQVHQVDVDPATPLLYVLRDTLGMHGAKYGCGLGQCGACTVMLDKQAIFSCLTPVSVLEGRQIKTVEGLGTAEHPGPLQQAFIDEQAAQCGYCIAGMIMRAQALLERNAFPTDAQIRAQMQPNLCRCGTHMRILAAIHRAAASMRQAALPRPPALPKPVEEAAR